MASTNILMDGSDILRAAGIDPDRCAGAVMVFRPGRPVQVVARVYVRGDGGVERVVKRFKLVAEDGGAAAQLAIALALLAAAWFLVVGPAAAALSRLHFF